MLPWFTRLSWLCIPNATSRLFAPWPFRVCGSHLPRADSLAVLPHASLIAQKVVSH